MDMLKTIQMREKQTGHSVYGPSQLDRIVACPASVKEGLRSPVPAQSSAASRGSMLHEVMTYCLMAHINGKNWQVPRWRSLDEEDKYAIRDCMDFAIPLLKGVPPENIAIEVDVSLEPWGIVEVYGTSDLNIQLPTKVITVDWKFGGTPVLVDGNIQIPVYSAGFIGYPTNGIQEVETYIAQPALDYFKSATYTVPELEGICQRVRNAIDLANGPNPPFNPGKKQCKFCPASMFCRARMKFEQENAKSVFAAYAQIVQQEPQVTMDELVDVLKQLGEVEAYASEIRKYFHAQLFSGKKVPGYKLVAGRSNRAFKNPMGALKWLKEYGGLTIKQLFKSKPISPAQAEKINPKLKKDDDFKRLVHKPEGSPQLVTEDDPRPALEVNDPVAAFANLPNVEEE